MFMALGGASGGGGVNGGYAALLRTGNGGAQSVTGAGFQPDAFLDVIRGAGNSKFFYDSVRGVTKYRAIANQAELTTTQYLTSFDADGFSVNNTGGGNNSTYVSHVWQRAASTGFDVVAWTGTAVSQLIPYTLSSAGRLVWAFRRDSADSVYMYHASSGANYKQILDNTAGRSVDTDAWGNTTPTGSGFTVGAASRLNTLGATYGAWIWADVTGVQKVGSFTTDGSGNATVTLGFKLGMAQLWPQDASGDRFIMDGKSNSTNSWTKYGILSNSLGEQTWPSTLAAVGNTSTVFGGLTPSTTYLYLASAA